MKLDVNLKNWFYSILELSKDIKNWTCEGKVILKCNIYLNVVVVPTSLEVLWDLHSLYSNLTCIINRYACGWWHLDINYDFYSVYTHIQTYIHTENLSSRNIGGEIWLPGLWDFLFRNVIQKMIFENNIYFLPTS